MLEKAIEDLKNGRMVLLHDSTDRENEIDIVVHAASVTAKYIRTMRQDGGGLICLAVGKDIAQKLKLPYMTDLMSKSNDTVKAMVPERTAYGDKPAFSLSINNRKTYTGVTDIDRTLTITEFARVESPQDLAERFYAPGHVHLLIAKTLKERRGHTELSCELARRSGLKETMVLCEMMGEDGRAMTMKDAKKYAIKHGIELVDGGEL
jgi:3,4-dihydroxy 2-butanone 4-phosphate synthase